MNYYFELVGEPMTEAQFEIYEACFKKAVDGYNIDSFIRDQKLKLAPEKPIVRNKETNYSEPTEGVKEFDESCKKEEIHETIDNKEQ